MRSLGIGLPCHWASLLPYKNRTTALNFLWGGAGWITLIFLIYFTSLRQFPLPPLLQSLSLNSPLPCPNPFLLHFSSEQDMDIIHTCHVNFNRTSHFLLYLVWERQPVGEKETWNQAKESEIVPAPNVRNLVWRQSYTTAIQVQRG